MLKMKISSDILIASLQALFGPAGKCKSDNLKYFLFKYKNQSLEISVFNAMEKAITTLSAGSFVSFETDDESDRHWLVESSRLLRASTIFEKDCIMDVVFNDDGVTFSSKSPAFNNRIQCSQVEEYPVSAFVTESANVPTETGHMPSSVLRKLLRATKGACGSMEEDPNYANINITITSGMAKAFATDGVRVAIASEQLNANKYPDISFSIEKTCADSLASGKMFTIPDEDISIRIYDNMLIFSNLNITYIASQISGEVVNFNPEDNGMIFERQVSVSQEAFGRILKFVSSVRSDNESASTEGGLCNVTLLENNVMRVDCDANSNGQSGFVEVASETKFGDNTKEIKQITWDSLKAFRSLATFDEGNQVHFFFPGANAVYCMANTGCLNYYFPSFSE